MKFGKKLIVILALLACLVLAGAVWRITLDTQVQGNLDFRLSQFGYLVVQQGTSTPGSGEEGQLYWDSDDEKLYVWDNDGTTWVEIGSGGGDGKIKVDAAATADYLGTSGSNGVLRTTSAIAYADGGDYITLDLEDLHGGSTAVWNGLLTGAVWDKYGRVNNIYSMSGVNQGEIVYWAAGAVSNSLPVGTDGQFLMTQGAGADPAWTTIADENSFGWIVPGDYRAPLTQVSSGSEDFNLTAAGGGQGVTAWTYDPSSTLGPMLAGGRSWCRAWIANEWEDPPDPDETTMMVIGHLPEEFKSWNTSAAISFDSRAEITGWLNTAGALVISVYDTAGALQHTETKTSWSVAGTWETDDLTAAEIAGTWTAGDTFHITITAARTDMTSIGGGHNPTDRYVDISDFKFLYDTVI